MKGFKLDTDAGKQEAANRIQDPLNDLNRELDELLDEAGKTIDNIGEAVQAREHEKNGKGNATLEAKAFRESHTVRGDYLGKE